MRSLLIPLLLAAHVSSGQTGPGGVGGSATNVLWLSADSGVYSVAGTTLASSGANVQQWNDRSGNGRHAIENTVGNRPNYQTNIFNGKPAVRFTAANLDRLVSTGISSANQASLWVVARYSSLPSPNPGLLQGSSAGNALTATAGLKHVGMWFNSTNTRPWGRGVRSDGTLLDITQTTNTTAGTGYIINSDYAATTIRQYVNNTVAGNVATDGTLRSWTDLSVGMQAGSEGWNGDIAEVIAYNTALNGTQRLIVANYLAAKYGLTLGTGDIYLQDNAGNGNFDHEVAGIGRTTATDLHTTARGSSIVQMSKAAYGGLGDNEYLLWGHDNGVLGAYGSTDFPPECQGRLQRVWRVSEVNASAAAVNVGDVDMTWDLTGLGTVVASELCLLIDTDNDGLFADESPIIGAVNVSGSLYRFSAVSALQNGRRFTLGTTSMSTTPLPIELLSFTASYQGGRRVQLDWSTASEQNNEFFTIERSTDMQEWEPVAQIPGAGNSSVVIDYQVLDENAPGPLCYYRLKQTDLDGTNTASDIVAVRLEDPTDEEDIVYPNPSTGPYTVVLRGIVGEVKRFTMIAVDGRSIGVDHIPLGEGRFLIRPGEMPPGLYSLQVTIGDRSEIRTVNVIR